MAQRYCAIKFARWQHPVMGRESRFAVPGATCLLYVFSVILIIFANDSSLVDVVVSSTIHTDMGARRNFCKGGGAKSTPPSVSSFVFFLPPSAPFPFLTLLFFPSFPFPFCPVHLALTSPSPLNTASLGGLGGSAVTTLSGIWGGSSPGHKHI